MGVKFGDKDAAIGHAVGGMRPEVIMNSIERPAATDCRRKLHAVH
jgi:hypothetical protein